MRLSVIVIALNQEANIGPCLASASFADEIVVVDTGSTDRTVDYWRGLEDANFRALRDLPKVNLEAATHAERQGSHWLLSTELHNASSQPALMVKLKAVSEKSGDRILPAIYSDNYIALMPGERRTIRTELEQADTRGEKPAIVIEGFNVR